MRKFNTTGLCMPDEDYMVDITGKLEKIKELVQEKSYFAINRGRQYGKTTTLVHLQGFLEGEYIVISLSFEGLGEESFADSENFCQEFLKLATSALRFSNADPEYLKRWLNPEVKDFEGLSRHISELCEGMKVVLIIDEVDKITNNNVFLNFLSMLRHKFLARKSRKDTTFHSVILAGVYDVKNIKFKLLNEGKYEKQEWEHKIQNSPWNIAVDFNVEMSFNPDEIATMLVEYEGDYRTGMDVSLISSAIYEYSKGYPYFVSRICQHIHGHLNQEWTALGVKKAVGIILKEDNELFKDMSKNMESHQPLYELLYGVLVLGRRIEFNYDVPTVKMAAMYGYIQSGIEVSYVKVANPIFEMRLLNYFVTKDLLEKPPVLSNVLASEIVQGGKFNMQLCLEKFGDFFNREIFPTKDKKLLELQYRLSFMSYLKPLLNGSGFMHPESQLADERRMDLVVDFGQEQFIIELKRVFSEKDRVDAFTQLMGYMELKGAMVGYLLTFDFRQKAAPKSQWHDMNGRKILEVNI
ncbi:MAG: AAA-like domain-containing protein [Turicibacter sp.]|nr:AAA-like domain-containing protein [Turicibacter sp.]